MDNCPWCYLAMSLVQILAPSKHLAATIYTPAVAGVATCITLSPLAGVLLTSVPPRLYMDTDAIGALARTVKVVPLTGLGHTDRVAALVVATSAMPS